MYPRSVRALQADALFLSALQHSDELNASQIRRAATVALHAYGGAGCSERVAQEFGDHPGDRSRHNPLPRASKGSRNGR